MRAVKEVREPVLSCPGRYEVVHSRRKNNHDPAPLKVKEVRVGDRRYIVWHNQEQADRDRADREAIVASLCERLKRGDKSLARSRGYRKYLKTVSGRQFTIDEERVQQEARFSGKWALQTDITISTQEVALKYKKLRMVVAPMAPPQHQVRAPYPSRLPQGGRDHSAARLTQLPGPDAFEGPPGENGRSRLASPPGPPAGPPRRLPGNHRAKRRQSIRHPHLHPR